MFPETGGISNIISDTIKVVFKRRLVDRVLRLWTEMARGQGFPRLDQIEPGLKLPNAVTPRERVFLRNFEAKLGASAALTTPPV